MAWVIEDNLRLLMPKPKLYGLKGRGCLWDDPHQDQWSKLPRIMVHQKNRRIFVQSGFIGFFDAPWSEWSWITDPDPDHPKGKHPKVFYRFLQTCLPCGWTMGKGCAKFPLIFCSFLNEINFNVLIYQGVFVLDFLACTVVFETRNLNFQTFIENYSMLFWTENLT